MTAKPEFMTFHGAWTITRRIAAAAGPDARFDGLAVFSDHAGGLRLTETGEMQLDGQGRFAATRRYDWRAGAKGWIDVFFDDGRYFHGFDPASTAPQAHHDCPPDIYDVRYDFTALQGIAPQWTAVWRVTGPRKDYVMTSTYNRA